MRTLIDDVFDELIDDLNRWHKKYGHDEDFIEEGLISLKDITDDYSDYSDYQISELNQDKSWARVDEAIEEERIRQYENS